MKNIDIGKIYKKGAVIFRENEPAQCMYIVLEGKVDMVRETPDGDVVLTTISEGEPGYPGTTMDPAAALSRNSA